MPGKKICFAGTRNIEHKGITMIGKVVISSIDFVYNWARSNSVWPLLFATSCCGIEMMCTSASKFDLARFGSEVFRGSPRQADLMITAGTITHKMAPAVVRLYQQMPEPKYVMAMGVCTVTGGMYENDAYSVVRGVDRIIPVDVYIPGCPPRPEALIDALIQLQKKIRTESLVDRQKRFEAHKLKVKLPEGDSEIVSTLDDIDVYHWGIQQESYELNDQKYVRGKISA